MVGAIGRFAVALTMLACLACAHPARAEDGYDLWLRYRPLPQLQRQAATVSAITVLRESPTLRVAAEELERGFSGLSGNAVARRDAITADSVVLATAQAPEVAALALPVAALNDEGYLIRPATLGGRRVVLVTAKTDRGVLYGAFALLR